VDQTDNKLTAKGKHLLKLNQDKEDQKDQKMPNQEIDGESDLIEDEQENN